MNRPAYDRAMKLLNHLESRPGAQGSCVHGFLKVWLISKANDIDAYERRLVATELGGLEDDWSDP